MSDVNLTHIDLSTYQPAEQQLAGRNILVTGAGDGIGRALAIGYARHGATVILLGRTVKKLESVYDEIEQAGFPQPAIYPLDFVKAAAGAFDQLGQILMENFAHLDGLVHNAAILGMHSPMVMTDPESWQKVIQVNLTAPYLITRSCFHLLKAAPSASVLFLSDAVALRGKAYWGAYSVAKAGLENFMQIIADEWENSTDIRVNSLDPGPVRTRLRREIFPGEKSEDVALPENLLPAGLYLIDGQQHAHRGQHWCWDRQQLSLSEI